MDRREAILRELNLYPLWVRRDAPVQTGAEDGALATVETMDKTAGQLAGETTGQSAKPTESGDKVAGYNPAKDAVQVIAYSHPARLANSVSQTGGDHESLQRDWPQLKEAVRGCSACKLRAGCTQTVFGVGDEQADWLFVGEGPGADEDALGEPFVGQAGKLLDNMLMAIKLKRGNRVYIANIVKCRPPGNRAPEVDEIAACLPYLQHQIELIQPKIIVALGKVASNALLGKDATLASLRGTLHDYRGIPLVVTYHPAYLLRSPSEKAKAWQDLRMAVSVMAGQ